MAIRKTGSRRIVVDRAAYLWRVRRRPTYDQALVHSSLSFCVQSELNSGAVLVLEVNRPRFDNWLGAKTSPLVPGEVANLVRQAIAAGWRPEIEGAQFTLMVDAEPGAAADRVNGAGLPGR